MNKIPALVVPALLVLALAGCGDDGAGGGAGGETGGSGGTGESGSGSGALSSDPAGNTACVAHGSWNLDINQAATDLGSTLTAKGLSVTSASGEGHQTIAFDPAGTVSTDTGLAYTIAVDMGDGVLMTMKQTHEGAPGGEWAWMGATNVIGFTNFETGYIVTTHIDINGKSGESATPLASSGLGAGTMTIISCDANSMTTQAAGSPFTQHWLSS